MVHVSSDMKKDLILAAITGFLAIALMITRLVMRKVRRQKFNWSDYLTMIAIFCMIARTVLTSTVMVLGNNNISPAFRAKHKFSQVELDNRIMGSKLTIGTRSSYNIYLWLQKGVVLLFYQRMLAILPWPERIMKAYWVILLLTLIPTTVVCFVECEPFHLYWQVVPDPGKCSEGALQMYILVSMNVFTDILLIILPIPWLLRIQRPLMQRLQLVGLFSLGIGLIVIALCRLPFNGNRITQVHRRTTGSIEGFFAAVVANVPALFSLRKSTIASSTINSRGVRNFNGETRDLKYAGNGFRASSHRDRVLVTHDIEIVSQTRTASDDVSSRDLRPGDDLEGFV